MAEQQSVTQNKKPVLLVISFGSSFDQTREATIGAIENAMRSAYPGYEVRRAFTSRTIIDILAKREKLKIDNVGQAMQRLVDDGIKEVVVQPTHIMAGKEYDDIIAELENYAAKFKSLRVGDPLLTEDVDHIALAKALADETERYNDKETAMVYMGHGTYHAANDTYSKLQNKLFDAGHDNCFIGTAKAAPTLDNVMALVKKSGAKKIVLLPLMVAAGAHACNDMAGDQENSWKTAFEREGYQVECVLKGLGEYDGVQQMFVDHAANAKCVASFEKTTYKTLPHQIWRSVLKLWKGFIA